MLPKAHSLTHRFCQQWLVELSAFAENTKFDSPFLPKTLKTIRKRTVTKTTLNITPHFWRQSSVMLLAFGEIGKWSKLWIFGQIWRRFLKTLVVLRFVYIIYWKMPKKFLKQTMKILCMCTFKCLLNSDTRGAIGNFKHFSSWHMYCRQFLVYIHP